MGTFTSPQTIPYWNETFYVVAANEGGSFAELAEVKVRIGEHLGSGQIVGRVGSVLNPEKIGDDAPAYIKRLKGEGNSSMLHLEVYSSRPEASERYRGGTGLGPESPGAFSTPPTDSSPSRKDRSVNF